MNIQPCLHELTVKLNMARTLGTRNFYMPYTPLSFRVLEILREMGAITSFAIIHNNKLGIVLKYSEGGRCAFNKITVIPKAGKRERMSLKGLTRMVTRHAQGFFIVSTSLGLLVDTACIVNDVGGEVLLHVDI